MSPSTGTRPTIPSLACPACAAELDRDAGAFVCQACGRRFATVAGVPDLRLSYSDPYVSREDDVERARELYARFDELDLDGLLRVHWERSGKPPELAERFLAGDQAASARAEACLDSLERHRGTPLDSDDTVLELGCGTAALAVAAARRTHSPVVAGDISMRWLILAKKRFAQLGVEDVRLVCCNGEEPPFAEGSFSVVMAGDVIEHVGRPLSFAVACGRIMRRDGVLFLATPNRFSLSLEPHVRLWGVGLLPRAVARRYVRIRRGTPYDHVRLLSSRGLRRLMSAASLEVTIVPPAVPVATRGMYTGVEGRLVDFYNRVRTRPIVRRVLLAVGPFFYVYARKREL